MKRFINLEELKIEKKQMAAINGGCTSSKTKKPGQEKKQTKAITLPSGKLPLSVNILLTMRYAIIPAKKPINPKL